MKDCDSACPDVFGSQFAVAYYVMGIFEAEMTLLLADSFQYGRAVVRRFRAIDIVEPQVKFTAIGVDLETVAIVQVGVNKRDIFDTDKLCCG